MDFACAAIMPTNAAAHRRTLAWNDLSEIVALSQRVEAHIRFASPEIRKEWEVLREEIANLRRGGQHGTYDPETLSHLLERLHTECRRLDHLLQGATG
jgi:hypothetical protein